MCAYWNIIRNTFLLTSHLPALPLCLTLLLQSPRGGWGAKEWLGMAVKSPSDNELSSADRSSHTFTQTTSSWATDLLFTLMPYNVFIDKNCVNSHQGLIINILFGIFLFWCSLWTFLCYFTVLHTYIHRVVLRVKTLTFRPFRSKVSTNQESKSEQKGQWTPLTVHYSALTLLVCVCQQVKSLSIGTIETHWIDSNDWFYPFNPLLSECFTQRQSWNQSQSQELQDMIQMHSRLSMTSNASGCQKDVMQQMLSKNMHYYACFVRVRFSKWENARLDFQFFFLAPSVRR